MESYEIMKETVDRVGAKQVAGALGVSTSLVYKWCEKPPTDENDTASGTRNPLDRVASLADCAQSHEPISWLCQQHKGFFANNPELGKDTVDAEFIARMQKMIQEFSELLTVMSKSIADDNEIDPKEADKIRREWEQLKKCSEECVCACEKGLFR